jgi:hypothetical protein
MDPSFVDLENRRHMNLSNFATAAKSVVQLDELLPHLPKVGRFDRQPWQAARAASKRGGS